MYRHRITSRYIYTYSIIENKQNLNVARNLLQFDVLTRPPPPPPRLYHAHAHTHSLTRTHTHTVHSTTLFSLFYLIENLEKRLKMIFTYT